MKWLKSQPLSRCLACNEKNDGFFYSPDCLDCRQRAIKRFMVSMKKNDDSKIEAAVDQAWERNWERK